MADIRAGMWKCPNCGQIVASYLGVLRHDANLNPILYKGDCPYCGYKTELTNNDVVATVKSARKKWNTDIPSETSEAILRHAGLDDDANNLTQRFNPKEEMAIQRYIRSKDTDTLRKKGKIKRIMKRKSINMKSIKKCKCK